MDLGELVDLQLQLDGIVQFGLLRDVVSSDIVIDHEDLTCTPVRPFALENRA